jgi:hypothetical protein
MIWAKTPAAASSIFCAVCIATAAVLPAVGPAADRLANTVSSEVNLKVRFDKLANFDAIPAYQALAAGDPTLFLALGSLNAIPAYLAFGLTGNTAALAGLSSLSAVPVIANALAAGDPSKLGGLDSLSAVPAYQKLGAGDRSGLYDIESTNAMQAFDKWSATGYTDLGAFEPNDSKDPALFNAGYAALSGANSWAKASASGNVADLAGIDAFSAIPALQTLGNPASTQADIWAAQRSLDSVSAIPEYQDAPDPTPPKDPPKLTVAKVTDPVVEKDAVTTTDGNKVTPKPFYLFGTGGGKNAADNGMPAYQGFLKAVQDGISGAVGGAPAPSAPSGGAPSADASGANP